MSDYIISHFDSLSKERGPYTDCTIQEAVNPHMSISQPTQNETVFSPRNPFNPECQIP